MTASGQDLLGLAVLAAAACGGALAGALRQVVHLAAIGLAALLSGPLSAPLEGAVAGLLGEGQGPLAAPLARLAAFAAVFVAAGVVGHLAAGALTRPGKASPAGRGLGALLGGGQAALGLWALCSLLALQGSPVGPAGFRLDPSAGDLFGFARDHNLLAWVAPREAALLRERLGAAGEEGGGPLERARRAAEQAAAAARRAGEALERVEKGGR